MLTLNRPRHSAILGFFTEIYAFRHLLRQLVRQQLTLRYRRTALGFVWTLLHPLLMLSVTAVVFSLVLRVELRDFGVFLFAGMVPWTLFHACVSQASVTIIANENLIKKIYVPRYIFPLASSLSLLIDTCLSMVSLFLLTLALGAKLSVALAFLPVSLALLYAFCLGISLLFSVVCVYFRDMEHIVGVLLQVAYYVTPIIYPLSRIPERYLPLFRLNPLISYVELFRSPLYLGALPTAQAVGVATVTAGAALWGGILVFRAFEHDLVFRL